LCPYSANDVPPEFTLLRIEGPDIQTPSIRAEDLPEDWPTRLEATRDVGSAWLERNEHVLLRVPSAIVPETMNCLFNPSHRQAGEFGIIDAMAYPFDPRLKR
jgi:RES domain-containing protein